MNWSYTHTDKPMKLVVTGEAESWLPALSQIVGSQWLMTRKVDTDVELLDAISSGDIDAAVLDDQSDSELDLLMLLRMIRRVSPSIPVVIVTRNQDRRYLEAALQLAVFSVVNKPLEFEDLLRQVYNIMIRLAKLIEQSDNIDIDNLD